VNAAQAKSEVQALDTIPLTDENVPQIVQGLVYLTKQLDFLVADEPGRPGLKKEVVNMQIVSLFRQSLMGLLESFLERARAHFETVFSGADFLARESPPVCCSCHLCPAKRTNTHGLLRNTLLMGGRSCCVDIFLS
jgi:hypothetical protein